MTLPAHALVSRAEVKAYKAITGATLDEKLDGEIGRWCAELETILGRRIVFRAPTDDDDAIVALANVADGALTVAGNPGAGGRTLVVTVTDANQSITAGTLTVTGTVDGVAGVTEAFDLALAGKVSALYGVKFFTAVSAAVITGQTGATAGTDKVKVGTSAGYTDYHSPSCGAMELWPIEWPVRQSRTVVEDGTVLVAGTDYQLVDRQRLLRLSSGERGQWGSGHRLVEHGYSAGYFTLAAVPGAIKQVALELVAWSLQYSEGVQGLSSVTDGLGSRSFSGPPMVTPGMIRRLAPFRNRRVGLVDRDFDLEAA